MHTACCVPPQQDLHHTKVIECVNGVIDRLRRRRVQRPSEEAADIEASLRSVGLGLPHVIEECDAFSGWLYFVHMTILRAIYNKPGGRADAEESSVSPGPGIRRRLYAGEGGEKKKKTKFFWGHWKKDIFLRTLKKRHFSEDIEKKKTKTS